MDDVLGLGGADPIVNNPFEGVSVEDTDTDEQETDGFIQDDDDLEIVDLRDEEADSDDEDEDGNADTEEESETTSELTDEELEALASRYKNDPKELAKALKHAQTLLSRQGNELGDLRKKVSTSTAESPSDSKTDLEADDEVDTSPKVGPNGFPVDEYGLEVIPNSYFVAGEFKDKVRDHLSNPANMIAYLESSGFSHDKAVAETRRAFDNDDLEDHVRAMSDLYKANYQENYRAAKSSKEQEASVGRNQQVSKWRDEQIARCETERKELAQRLNLGASAGQRVGLEVHNLAVALVQADVKAGRLTQTGQFDPEIVPDYYDKALAKLVRQGRIAELVQAPGESDGAAQSATVRTRTGASVQTTQSVGSGEVKTAQDLGRDARTLYDSFKRVNPELTVEQFAAKHGKTVNMKK